MMPTPSSHEAVVARVLADARPVRPLSPPRVRVLWWIAFELGAIALAAASGLRDDLARALAHPAYLLELAVLAIVGAAAAGVAFRSAVPGCAPAWRPFSTSLLVASLVALLALLEPSTGVQPSLAIGARCAICVVGFGLLPSAVLFVGLRRGAPLEPVRATAYAGAAAFLLALASIRVACPIDDRVHLLSWHLAPAIGAASLFAALAARRLDPLARIEALR